MGRAAVLGFAVVVTSGVDNGGYFERTWGWLALGFAAVAALALLRRDEIVVGVLELVTLAALAALLSWMLLSGLWGTDGTDWSDEAARTFVYLAALAAFALVVAPRANEAFLQGLVAGISVLAAYGLIERLASDERDPFQGTLLAAPLGYANAMGILAAIGIVVSLGLATRGRMARWAFLALAALLGLVLLLTESRGAVLALVCGLVALVLAHPARARVLRGRRLAEVCAVLVAVAVAAATAILAVAPTDALGDRPDLWEAALEDARDHPLAGSGAGTFEEYWDEHGSAGVEVRDAHSLYLETAGELGVVGFTLLLVVLAAPLAALAASPRGHAEAAAVAGLAAFLVHAGLDWDWELPAVTLAGLACAAALLAAARDCRPLVLSGRPRVAALCAALVACAVATALGLAS